MSYVPPSSSPRSTAAAQSFSNQTVDSPGSGNPNDSEPVYEVYVGAGRDTSSSVLNFGLAGGQPNSICGL